MIWYERQTVSHTTELETGLLPKEGLTTHQSTFEEIGTQVAMESEPKRISISELSENLSSVLKQIGATGETVLIENEEGRLISLNLVSSPPKSAEDLAAFLSAAGSWCEVNVDQLIDEMHASRDASIDGS